MKIGKLSFLSFIFVYLNLAVSSSCLYGSGTRKRQNREDIPVILWWTPFTGAAGNIRQCKEYECFFTENRTFVSNSNTKVIMFYGSDFSPVDLPLPREPHHQWALLHEESPKNNPIICHEGVISLFNYTATWSRNSTFPLTFLSLKRLSDITDKNFFIPMERKNQLKIEEKLAPLVYVQSSCDAPSQRDLYIAEIMKHIPVDSYGKCLNNKKLPDHLQDPAENMDSDEFFQLMAKYKFTLAFENAVGDDYITEKLWRTLKLGSIPVYLGSSSVEDWLPNNLSAILVNKFSSPEELAETLRYLDGNDSAYNEYLSHKIHQRVSNSALIKSMEDRCWGDDLDQENFVEAFECHVCEQIHRRQKLETEGFTPTPSIANTGHYKCSVPVNPVTREENKEIWWTDHWKKTAIEAEILQQLIKKRMSFSPDDFFEAVAARLLST